MVEHELDTFETYLKEIGATPLLTREEEILFAQRIEQNLKQYHHSILSSAYLLQAAVDLLESVRSGKALPHKIIEMSPVGVAEKQRLRGCWGADCRGSKTWSARIAGSSSWRSIRTPWRSRSVIPGGKRSRAAPRRCASWNNCRRGWRCCNRPFKSFKDLPGRWKCSGNNWIGRERPAASEDAKSSPRSTLVADAARPGRRRDADRATGDDRQVAGKPMRPLGRSSACRTCAWWCRSPKSIATAA